MIGVSSRHSFAVLGTLVVFAAGIALIPCGIWYALIAVFLAALCLTYAKKIEEEFHSFT
ncbi:MAG: hypothetical protein ACXV5G_10105 [Halobacteriota archaeon]